MLKVEQQHAETFRTQSVLMLLNVIDVVNNDNYCRYYLISDSHVISSSCL